MIDSQKIAQELNLPRVGLINDWEAGAYGIGELETKDFEVLNQGTHDAKGNRAVISTGTGLGEGVCISAEGSLPKLLKEGRLDRKPFDKTGAELVQHAMNEISDPSVSSKKK